VTEADIAAYEAAKDDFTEEERAAFYASVDTAHESLDFGGLYDGVIPNDENASTTDPDLILELMMTDIMTLTANAAAEQQYRMPIYTLEEVPAYALALETTYPPRYLLEVMVRDELRSLLDPAVGMPDRESYFRTGMAMGLYYESDVERTREFVEGYVAAAGSDQDFAALVPNRDTSFSVPADINMSEAEFDAFLAEGMAEVATSTLTE
jgi:hypothetical protein